MKKGCLIAVAVAVALIAGVVFLALGLTRGLADAGNAFLSQIGAGKISEAYESASATLKSQQTLAEFEETVKKLGLTDYASASWSNRETNNDRGNLEGTVTTRSGGKIPLHLELIKEGDKWKVYSLEAPPSGAHVEKSAKSIPPDDKLKQMVLQSLLAFNEAVKAKDFTAFQQQGGSAFRDQVSPEKLLAAFKEFVDQEIDISSVEKTEPVFDPPPAIDSDGVLVVKGSSPTQPKPVLFELKYIYEGNAWKLVGIDVKIH